MKTTHFVAWTWLFITLPGICLSLPKAFADYEAGLISESHGSVEVVRAGGEATLAGRGDAVYVGDLIKTGTDSRVVVRFQDESELRLGPSAEIRISGFEYGGSGQSMDLQVVRGLFRLVTGKILKDSSGEATIELPSGNIGIRGTTLLGESAGARSLIILLSAGRADTPQGSLLVVGNRTASGQMESVIDRRGYGVIIEGRGAVPSEPFPVQRERVEALVLQLGLDASYPEDLEVNLSGPDKSDDASSVKISNPAVPFPKHSDQAQFSNELEETADVGLDNLVAICGDRLREGFEECDDGNRLSGDGCNEFCRNEGLDLCGNGRLDPGERCDDGNLSDGDGCSRNCQFESLCGDGVTGPGEECDDGNRAAGDGCSRACLIEREVEDPSVSPSPSVSESLSPSITPTASPSPPASITTTPTASPTPTPSVSPSVSESLPPDCRIQPVTEFCDTSVSSCSGQCTWSIETCNGVEVSREFISGKVTGGSYSVQTPEGSIECDCVTNQPFGATGGVEFLACNQTVTVTP